LFVIETATQAGLIWFHSR